MKKKLLVNLFAGPGTGKSRNSARIFAEMKDRHINAELVREYIKRWVWEGRKFAGIDQTYIMAKQARLEREVSEGVEFIITDSPVWLSPFYASQNPDSVELVEAYKAIAKHHYSHLEAQGYEIINVFLTRSNKYNPAGRIQTHEEAKELDSGIKQFLVENSIHFVESSTEGADILDLIEKFHKKLRND